MAGAIAGGAVPPRGVIPGEDNYALPQGRASGVVLVAAKAMDSCVRRAQSEATSPGTQETVSSILRVLPKGKQTRQRAKENVEPMRNFGEGKNECADEGDDVGAVCTVCQESAGKAARCIECPNCSGRTHAACLHKWFVSQNCLARTAIARKGTCPCCRGPIRWEEAVADMRDRASGGTGRVSGLLSAPLVMTSERELLMSPEARALQEQEQRSRMNPFRMR